MLFEVTTAAVLFDLRVFVLVNRSMYLEIVSHKHVWQKQLKIQLVIEYLLVNVFFCLWTRELHTTMNKVGENKN